MLAMVDEQTGQPLDARGRRWEEELPAGGGPMSVRDLLLWVTEVTMFGRKSVGSGLTTRYPLNFHSPFSRTFPPESSLSSLSSLEKTPA